MRKLVLLALADMGDSSGTCTASLQRIAKATGASRRSVIDHLAALENEGFLVSHRRYRANGRQAVNAYYLASSPQYYWALKQKIAAKEPEKVLS